MAALIWVAGVLCFDINEEFCTWQVVDTGHFDRLAWQMDTGERLLLGMLQGGDDALFNGPLFLKPAVRETVDVPGGARIGHYVAFVRCSGLESWPGGLERFNVTWHPAVEKYLFTVVDDRYDFEYVAARLAAVQEEFLAGQLYYWPSRPRQRDHGSAATGSRLTMLPAAPKPRRWSSVRPRPLPDTRSRGPNGDSACRPKRRRPLSRRS